MKELKRSKKEIDNVLDKYLLESEQIRQLKFTTDLLSRIEHYNNLTKDKDYIPSQKELQQYKQMTDAMLSIIKNFEEVL